MPTRYARPIVLTVMSMSDELERCIATEYTRLVRVVALVTDSQQLAEDCVQEAFARAWERAARGETFAHLAGWVVTTALNQARSGRRRRAAEVRALRQLPPIGPVKEGETVDLTVVVRSAVSGLASRQRDAVILYYLLDMDVASIATALGVAEGTIKTALSRARHTLALILSDEELDC